MNLILFADNEGPAMNSIVSDSEEPMPSLSDWHDYEPQLEFDDTELTHAPEQSNCFLFNYLSMFTLRL